MNVEAVLKSAAGVVRAFAEILATVPNLERNLRIFAEILESETDGSSPKARRKRGPMKPRPTVEFTDLDAHKAAHGLAKCNIREMP